MRTNTSGQPIAQLTEVKVEEGRLLLRGTFALSCPLPKQDADLPMKLEQTVEEAGQQIKRLWFRQALEYADLDLLLDQRQGTAGQGFQRRGRKRYPFKAVFGTVTMRRQQVKQKADGRVVLPSAAAWQTPERMCITPGLRAAVCDGMLEQSVRKTAARVTERAGEENLLSPSACLQIVHEEGERLQTAQQERAAAVLHSDAEAARRLLPPGHDAAVPSTVDSEEFLGSDVPVDTEAVSAANVGAAPPLGFPGSLAAAQTVAQEQARQVDAGWVVVEPDEVKVHAQPHTGQKDILVYTTVVLTESRRWYVTAGNAGQLIYQVAALLACLGVHQGKRSLLFLADGARWIRDWFEKLQVSSKSMILCWYHVVKRCQQQLSMACYGRKHREQVQMEVLGHLWEGRVDEAIAVLQAHRREMRVALALDQLVAYLSARRTYIPNYRVRQQAGLWIASNRVEKFNDWSVSERCKHQGMAWTAAGVVALATLEGARRNGDLKPWRETQNLPPWTERQAA